jgi:hypothetical protein
VLLLTRTDLILIRAALQFFDEEMRPHGARVMQPYLDEPLTSDIAEDTVRNLRERLKNCQLAYVHCNPTTMTSAMTDTILNLNDASPPAGPAMTAIATILLPSAME